MQSYLKILLIAILLGCLLKMPYGYYQFARYGVLVGFAILAYQDYMLGKKQIAFLFVVLAFLFQPVFKLPFTREIWCIIDVLVALYLGVNLYQNRKVF